MVKLVWDQKVKGQVIGKDNVKIVFLRTSWKVDQFTYSAHSAHVVQYISLAKYVTLRYLSALK